MKAGSPLISLSTVATIRPHPSVAAYTTVLILDLCGLFCEPESFPGLDFPNLAFIFFFGDDSLLGLLLLPAMSKRQWVGERMWGTLLDKDTKRQIAWRTNNESHFGYPWLLNCFLSHLLIEFVSCFIVSHPHSHASCVHQSCLYFPQTSCGIKSPQLSCLGLKQEK